MADMRYAFIEKVCAQTVVKPRESKAHTRSRKLDQILTGKWTAIPVFVLIMALVFYLTFGLIGTFLSDLLDMGIQWLTDQVDGALTIWGVNEVVHSLVIDGVFAGVGTVLSFLPFIVVLFFFFIGAGGATATLAGVAFVMDKLRGKSACPGEVLYPCSSASAARYPPLWPPAPSLRSGTGR